MRVGWKDGAGLTGALSRWGTALTERLTPHELTAVSEAPQPRTRARADVCGVVVVSARADAEWSEFVVRSPAAFAKRRDREDAPDALIIDLTSRAAEVARALGPLRGHLGAATVALVSEPEGAAAAARLGVPASVYCGRDRLAGARAALSVCRALGGRPVSYDALQQTHRDLQDVHARLLADSIDASARQAMIVHDLRSPLGVVHGVVTELLESAQLESEDRKLVALMAHASVQLGALVDRLEQLYACGGDSQRLERVDLSGLARGVVEGLRYGPEAQGKRVEVHAEAAYVVRGDRQDLVRVLSNLLGNALRHARTQVDVHVEADERDVRVTVSDDGPGIALKQRAELFHRVVRNPGAGRMGLGLAIVHRAVERHGGRVQAIDRSERDGPGHHGACFVVRLPIHAQSC